MTNKELKTVLKLAENFLIGGFVLWILETGIFLIIEGWHWKATNPIEIILDHAVGNIWKCASLMIVYYVIFKICKLK